MTRSAAWSFIVVLSFALVACKSGPKDAAPVAAGDGTAEGSQPISVAVGKPSGLLLEPADTFKLGYTIDWATSVNLPSSGELYSASVLGDLLVIVERPNNVVTAISMRDGKQLWRQQAGTFPYRAFAPARVDNTILVNTETQMFMFDASKEGKLISRANLDSTVVTQPAMVGEIAVFGGADGMIFGFDTRVGYAKWKFKMPGQMLVPAQASGQQVFVAGIDGQYALFAGRTGEVLWRGRVFDKVSAAPAVHSSGIYVPSQDHSLYALNRATGEDRWIFRYTDDLVASPIVLQNTVYQPLPSGELVALKVTDGAELWRLKTTDKLVAQDARGLIFNGGDKVVQRDAGSGKMFDQIPVVGGKIAHLVQAEGQALIVVSTTGRVLKLSQVK